MFIGEYKHSIDEKGRIAFPVKFRPDFGSSVFVTKGLDHCLFVFTRDEWEQLAKKISATSFTNQNARAFARLMLSGAVEAPLDKQGRILLPDYLREYAGISAKAVVAGVYSRVEIWDETKWGSYKAETEAAGDEIAEKLGELGI
ncbi:MAG: cell division/cell wall cluster transcriptional repressor MraZ [Candidatus Harrisonbacteria bacterium CG10_big_fil_rev_8_21_14_0_10_49_15]|uniref:Transcriptional regulator MraZ n=1 Tax=Candidatus Harrisonbacteria bacterium CG10_big_fil_rev_8_21_14_0_10_49_15 TaxID=1974587 RepID=A0A2H0UN03_9BACT|nr:MAG: cell division/cell wall cluster transcriptional repressor MraZ [Candidatus Harrisonbacteria bacterium CG10_big_fil_rev_8_21_14_0_10_49_15]